MRLWASAAAAVVAALPAIAGAQAPVRVVSVVTVDDRFVPARLVLKRGVAYRLHIENHGTDTHEFHARAFFASVKLANPDALNADRTEIVVNPGEAKDLRFVPTKAGHYPLRCPDHDWDGMTGTITVK